MHIAVCIDNAADRKQMERLLKRASDLQDSDHVYYIDSYGNSEAILRKPHFYDMFFVDMLEDKYSSIELILKLFEKKVTCPIILCPSKLDYRAELNTLPLVDKRILNYVFFLDQPVKVEELHKILEIGQEFTDNRISKMELRGTKDTLYVKEEELVYAITAKDRIIIHLTENRQVEILQTMLNFYSENANFKSYRLISNKIMVNINYIKKIDFFGTVTLIDGTKLKGSIPFLSKLKQV